MVVRFRDVSERMLELGYEPIPSNESKIPVFSDWTNIEVDLEQVQKWNENGVGDLNASTRLGREVRKNIRLAMIDVDVLDTPMAKRMWHTIEEVTLGSFPGYRCGNAPKFAIPVLVRGVDKKLKSKILIDPKGRESAIEVLNQGQQVVMYGKLKNGDGSVKQYKWHRADPLNIPVEELPTIDAYDIEKIFNEFEITGKTCGWIEKGAVKREVEAGKGKRRKADTIEDAMANLKAPSATLMEMEEELRYIPPDVGNDIWFRILAAIHFETEGSLEGLHLAQKWSRGDFSGVRPENYKGPVDVEKRFYSFKDALSAPKATFGTIRTIANDYRGGPTEQPVITLEEVDDGIDMSEAIAPSEDVTESLPPMMQDIVQYYKGYCSGFYAPLTAAMVAIHTVAFALQRSFGLHRSGALIARPHLYHLQILPTGMGKAAIQKTLPTLLHHMMGEERCQGIINNVGSPQGLEDELLIKQNLLWLQDEIADKLGDKIRSGPQMREALKAIYGLSSERIAQRVLVQNNQRREIPPAVHPHLSIIGSTTPSKLSSVIDHMDALDGFLNRFIAINVPKSELVVLPYESNVTHPSIPGSLTDWMNSIQIRMDFSDVSDYGASPATPEVLRLPVKRARFMYDGHQDMVMSPDKSNKPLMVRRFENTMKVALCIQLAADPDATEVTEDVWEWALRYVDHSITSMYNLTMRGMVDPSYVMDESDVMRTVREIMSETHFVSMKLKGLPSKLAFCGLMTLSTMRKFISKSSRLDRELVACMDILKKTGEISYLTGIQLRHKYGIPVGPRNNKDEFYFLVEQKDMVREKLLKVSAELK